MPRTHFRRTSRVTGVTLIELLVALAIMVVVTATLLPVLAAMRNHWGATMAASEITQHARILFDHLHRELAQAQHVVTLSAPDDPDGFLEIRNRSGEIVRYNRTHDGDIRFGTPGSRAGLVAAVESFHVLGYDSQDRLWPAREPKRIRLVGVQVTFAKGGSLGRQRTWQGLFFLRSAPADYADGSTAAVGPWKSAPVKGTGPARAQPVAFHGTIRRDCP